MSDLTMPADAAEVREMADALERACRHRLAPLLVADIPATLARAERLRALAERMAEWEQVRPDEGISDVPDAVDALRMALDFAENHGYGSTRGLIDDLERAVKKRTRATMLAALRPSTT